MPREKRGGGVVRPRSKAILTLLIVSLMWSTSGYFLILIDWNPIAITGTRSAIALIPMIIMFGKPRLPKSPPAIIASICFATTMLLFVTANQMTNAANVILLQYTAPIYVAFMAAWLLKERLRKEDIITLLIVMIGLALFFLDDLDFRGMWGNILALISGFTLAGMSVCIRMLKDSHIRPADAIMWGNILSAVIAIPFIFIYGLPAPVAWLWMGFLGLFQLGLSYCLYVRAVKHVTALELSLIPIVETFFNPLIVAVFAFQIPGVYAIIGGVAVVSAVTWNLVSKERYQSAA